MGVINIRLKRLTLTVVAIIAGLIAGLSNALAARPLVDPNATIAPFDLTYYNNTMDGIFGNGNWNNVTVEGATGSIFQPYVDALGPVAYLIVIGGLGLAYYIKTEHTMIAGIITITDGALLLWMIPYDWQYMAYGIIMIGIVATIWGLVVRRGS
jgi:hypothetical protein